MWVIVCVAALSFGELLRGVINGAANELAALARVGEVMMISASFSFSLRSEIANEMEIGAEEKGRIHCRKFYVASFCLLRNGKGERMARKNLTKSHSLKYPTEVIFRLRDFASGFGGEFSQPRAHLLNTHAKLCIINYDKFSDFRWR